MDDQTQKNNDISSGFLIKDKQGNIKKVRDDIVADYQIDRNSTNSIAPASPSSAILKSKTIITTPSLKTEQSTKNSISDASLSIQPSTPQIKNINPQPFAPISSAASFIGEPDEEEEIRQHQDELNKILEEANLATPIVSYEIFVGELTSKFNLQFDNEILKKRFQKIVESSLKDIRSPIETVEVLHRQTKVGGLDFSEDQANNIVKYINEHRKNISQGTAPAVKKDLVDQPQIMVEESHPTDFSNAPPSFIPIPKMKEVEKKDIKIEIKEPIVEKAEVKVVPKVINSEKIDEKPVEDLYKRSSVEEMANISGIRQQNLQRPQVIDIRQPSSVVGPIEELMQIDLKEFRRMGNNPGESAEKILEKIYLLEEESWNMRMDGIDAWQKSPLYKKYIAIGLSSLKQNKSVIEIINSQEKSDTLSFHFQEFLAINDLNNKLAV